jgi:hypothetical protein
VAPLREFRGLRSAVSIALTPEHCAQWFLPSPQYDDPFPRLQIVTIEHLPEGFGPRMPSHRQTFEEAPAAPSFTHVQDTELL